MEGEEEREGGDRKGGEIGMEEEEERERGDRKRGERWRDMRNWDSGWRRKEIKKEGDHDLGRRKKEREKGGIEKEEG